MDIAVVGNMGTLLESYYYNKLVLITKPSVKKLGNIRESGLSPDRGTSKHY